ncbi:MAG: MATE family efflux transporter [Prevotella sp.]|nr:MATE family efflux transporter [Prevotella sp.]
MKAIDRDILRLALPSIVSNITVPLLGLCDVTIMGHVGGAESIGAIAVGSMIFNVMYWLFVFLRMSTGGLTAQAFGAGNQPQCRAVLSRSLSMALSFGAAIVVLQVPLQWLTFWLMQPTENVAALCTHYYYICIWGAPAVLGMYAVTGWLIGMQDTRRPMLIAIVQNVVNIALSLLLVVCFHLGIVGVAIGTLVAQWVGFAVGIICVITKYYQASKSNYSPPYKGGVGGGSGGSAGSGGSVEIIFFLRTLCLVSVNLYFTSAGASQGALVLAANTLLMQFFMLFSYIMDGFANAGEALAGRFLGAQNSVMLKVTVRRLFGWALLVTALFTAVYALGGPMLLTLLTDDNSVIATALDYLPWAVLVPLCGMAAFVWDGIFTGVTRPKGMLAACFLAAVVFFALWFLLSPHLSNHALWVALLSFLAVRGVVQTIVWHSIYTACLFHP